MRSEQLTLAELLAAFDRIAPASETVTASELATELNCPQDVTTSKLTEFRKRGTVDSRTLDTGTRVWWPTTDVASLDDSQFRSLVNAVEEYAIFMLDPDGRVVTWNEGAKQLKGYTRDEIIGEYYSTFYTEEDTRAGVPDHNLKAAKEQGRIENEGWRVRKDGSQFWANVVVTAIRDEDGTLQGFAKITRDMTERRNAKQQLRTERDLIEQLFEAAPVGISVSAPDGTLIRANSRAIEQLGLPHSNLEQSHVTSWGLYNRDGDRVPPEDHPVIQVIETGEPVTDYRCRVECPTHGWRWLSITAAPITTDDGAVERIIIAVDDVTDQQERERQLRRERNQTRRLLETSPTAISVQDANGDVVLANSRAQELLGLSEQEIIDQPEDADEWTLYGEDEEPLTPDETPAARVHATGDPVFDEELVIERPNGDRNWFAVNAAPVFGPDGTLERVITAGEDITELKARERELEQRKRELETELSEILGRISEGFYALNEEWQFTHINEQAEETLEHSSEDLYGKSMWDVFPDAAGEPLWDEFNEAMATQTPTNFEVHDSNLDKWYEVNAYPSETGLSVYFRDVTERVEQERALEASERRYRTLAENFPNGGVILYDDDLRFTLAAGQAFDELGMSTDDLVGQPFDEAFSGASDAIEAAYRAPLKGNSDRTEVEYAGREWLIRTVPVTDGGGDISMGMAMAQDITDRKERERRLDQFASMVAHELRNPVTVGQIYSQQLPADKAPKAVEYVSDAFDRMEDMIDVLLVLARGHKAVGEREPVSLADVAQDAWAEVDAPDATLDVEADRVIQADETYIWHLCENLFENAVEHGGADVEITIGDLPTGFYVADNGSGISPDDRDAVFDAGYTTAASKGGTGLGLAFVRELAEAYEWTCTVTASEAGGARFEFMDVTVGSDE